ncbi:hypothetical protein MA16_Dca021261 [Dendrobium catenatum]|uniref:Uncharacterized protein n=1 Tax=Dendrobium catenatum TaxID=906689 RepID=A0A2I0W5K3_9ASPA|nr:hypothetical protein MA16_Dca021261 [Dendrobium catenatum]
MSCHCNGSLEYFLVLDVGVAMCRRTFAHLFATKILAGEVECDFMVSYGTFELVLRTCLKRVFLSHWSWFY